MKTLFLAACIAIVAMDAASQDLPPPLTDDAFHPVRLEEARLGQLLFYDPILSGNQTVACVTCHHPKFGTSDGVSLSIGDGGIGLGPSRVVDPANVPEERIPRNSPALFNLGAKEFTRLFHDGRLERDPSRAGGIRTPMDDDMVTGFASILSAQTMFPVLSRDEMAGSFRENPVAQRVRQGLITGPDGAWDQLARRVSDIPAYADQFVATYPAILDADDIAFTDISNAIAAFMAFEWRSDTAPFDAMLRGTAEFSGPAQEGLDIFYGDGQCAVCHAGPLLTDHDFHAMAAPQIGPGKSASFQDHQRDDGRFNVTGEEGDRYAFRTPSLRNVALTAPYGHAGAHRDLAAFIADHASPAAALSRYDKSQAILPDFEGDYFAIMNDPAAIADIAAAVQAAPVTLTADQIAALVAFLDTLTDPISITGRLGSPTEVPSGVPVPQVD